MNSLSWFLYLADIVSRVGVVLTLLGVACLGIGGFGWLAWTVCKGNAAEVLSYHNGEESSKEWLSWAGVWQPLKKFLPVGVVCVLAACLLPGKNTVYAIAASEMGEKIVQNEGVMEFSGDVAKALQNWIKQQLSVPEKKGN